jgi:hypothetical protein
MKSPEEIRNELLSAFLALDQHYTESPLTSEKISYLNLELAEHLLNSIKAIQYHYSEEIPEMRIKRKWGEEMVRADKLLKKYSENSDSTNPHSPLQLKRKFDESGYLEQKDFLGEMHNYRTKLKRTI